MHTGDVQTKMWSATRCAGSHQRTPTTKSTRRAVFEGQRFEQRKVSAAHEHVGARASPSYAHEECKHTTLVGPWRLSARGEEASATHAHVNRMRWPPWVPGRVGDFGVCPSPATAAHANDTCVGLRTIKYGWMDASTPCKVMHASLSICIFVSLLLIVFLVINAVYYHADCYVNPFIE